MNNQNLITKLTSKFSSENRYANFGPILNTIEVDGFRGISASVKFDFPITAITGLNGAGKSTIGQLSLCAYRVPLTSSAKRYYVRDFFPLSPADPAPFTLSASVRYHYQTDKLTESKFLTVSRAQTEWSGYKRQPERLANYIGFTVYIPKVERRDFSVYRSNFELTARRNLLNGKQHVGRILSSAYDEMHFQGIQHKNNTTELGVVARYGYQYSENNMGFGEGRAIYTVDRLESSPEQSLFVIEEPETSLHESAQQQLVSYLLDVCWRRHHQIILTTYSPVIMEALPASACKFLHRDLNGVKVFDGFSSNRVRAILSDGSSGRTIIAVEDDFAVAMVREIIRQHDQSLLKAVSISAIGDKNAVRSFKEYLDLTGTKSIAIRDADVGAHASMGLLSLPGTKPPEVEIFEEPLIAGRIKTEMGFDVAEHLANYPETNHHAYVETVAKASQLPADHVMLCVIQWFLAHKGKSWSQDLFSKIAAKV